MSFVQIRGNIPLIWKSSGEYLQSVFQNTALRNHFLRLHALYGEVAVINLLNNGGAEKFLHDAYEFFLRINKIPVKYIAWDFHQLCAVNKTAVVDSLVPQIAPFLKTAGFYRQDRGRITGKQTGVVRTNCVDCLDRTNVVQSAIAQAVFVEQLAALDNHTPIPIEGILTVQELADLNSIWEEHANQMSFRYTQTDAMKTDFLRNGRREFTGYLKDGVISIKRNIISVKTDQYQKPQEIVNFILGKTQFAENVGSLSLTQRSLGPARALSCAPTRSTNARRPRRTTSRSTSTSNGTDCWSTTS